MEPSYRSMKRRSVPFQGLKRSPRSKSKAPQEIETLRTTDALALDAQESEPSTTIIQAPVPADEARTEDSVWKVCLAVRLINSLLVQTYFNPDEHWQALEVAHRTVFG